MIKLCLEEIFFMLAKARSEAELEVECAIKGIEQQALLDAAMAFLLDLFGVANGKTEQRKLK